MNVCLRQSICLACVVITGVTWANACVADSREQLFEKQIRPLLMEHCVQCHGPDKQESGLRLDSRQQVLHGTTDADALVVPGKHAESRLLQVIQYAEDDTQMPPKARLPDSQISAVRQWIDAGAYWPEDHDFGSADAFDANAWKRHWAFQPVADPGVPQIGDAAQNPIDAFVRRTLHQKQLDLSPRASVRDLVRRVSYAVTGLPPKIDDLDAAREHSKSGQFDAWLNGWLDQQLATPQFGERWARYWLDMTRYADTRGYVFQQDREYAHAWRYREWVINSLNADMPYDEFLKRQIAADQLPGADDPAQLAAMGFFTLGRRFLNNTHDIIDDRIDVLSRGTMALTVTCARCHDHKFDPIPQADYYALYGVFRSSDEPNNDPSPLRLVDKEKPHEPVIFLRGNPASRGDRVARRFLTALSGDSETPQPFTKGSGRLELADRIANADNPLTARVAVNRIWMRLFGQGLVDSPSDFGVRTPAPSHPELLDHLATWFMRHNWSRKQLIRYIITSSTWQQSSTARSEVASTDPENRLVSYMSRRRLDLEAFRDSVLTSAGTLDMTVGGKSVDITTWPFPLRRTVYARIDRQNLPGTFRTFDFASPDSHAPKRYETTVPQQALYQLNSPFLMEQAQHLADTVASAYGDAGATITEVYRKVLLRSPDSVELDAATQFLTQANDATPPGDTMIGWQYGWGELAEEQSRLLSFQSFPVYHDERWGGGNELPDSTLGWCMLKKTGGHTGSDRRHCPIRRWVADRDCNIDIQGTLKHGTEKGDGVHGHVFCAGTQIASAAVHNSGQQMHSRGIKLKAGDIVDFVVDCRDNESHDSFEWKVTIRQQFATGSPRSWNSEKEFSSRQPLKRLTPLAQLAQTLMLTNEFMFID